MNGRSVGLACLFGALVVLIPEASGAQLAHPGYSGLISTPDARVMPQGQIALGFNWLNGPGTYLFAPRTNRIYAVTVGVLPGLETTLRQTQVIGWVDPEAPGAHYAFDRMFSAKYALPLPAGYPKVAIGMQDIASGNFLTGARGVKPGMTQYGQTTLYGVIGERLGNWEWHGGIASSQKFLDGFFTGIRYQPWEQISVLGEWEAGQLNWGIQLQPFPGFWLLLSSIHQTTWGLSSELRIAL